MKEVEILQYLKAHCQELSIELDDIFEIKRISTGKRNDCYSIQTKDKKLFCKIFNKELRFASQFDKTRYYVELSVLNFLQRSGCSVPEIIYSDDKCEIMFLEFIPGKTLKQKIKENPDSEAILIEKALNEISKIHNLEVREDDFPNITFKKMEKNNYYNSMGRTLCLLYEFLGVKDKKISDEDKRQLKSIAENLANQESKYGHFELHNDNVMFDGTKVHFVDFEKFYPHPPQLDLISLIMNGNINKNNINEYIQYYMKLNGIVEKEAFLYTLDCASLFYNLKIIDMIIRNSLGYETKWEEVDGQRVKKLEKTNSNFGVNWNSERNESLEMRIRNIYDFNFSQNNSMNRTKNNLIEEILQKLENRFKEER